MKILFEVASLASDGEGNVIPDRFAIGFGDDNNSFIVTNETPDLHVVYSSLGKDEFLAATGLGTDFSPSAFHLYETLYNLGLQEGSAVIEYYSSILMYLAESGEHWQYKWMDPVALKGMMNSGVMLHATISKFPQVKQ